MKYIEYTGIAGAGKSTISQLLYDIIKSDNIDVVNTKDIGYIKPLAKLLVNIKKTSLLLLFQFYYVGIFKKNKLHFFKRWTMLQARMEYITNTRESKVAILDEGLVHVFRGFRRITNNRYSIEYFYDHKIFSYLFQNIPDIIIYVSGINCNYWGVSLNYA